MAARKRNRAVGVQVTICGSHKHWTVALITVARKDGTERLYHTKLDRSTQVSFVAYRLMEEKRWYCLPLSSGWSVHAPRR